MFNFDDANKKSMETMDGMLKGYSELARGFQTIAAEAGDYSRKSFEDMTAFMESLVAARSLEEAYEAQTTYLKSTYDVFVAEATRMSELYADLARNAYKQYETASAPEAPSLPVVTPAAAETVDAA